jgi:tetratricopeptide (TPR) repeat protein
VATLLVAMAALSCAPDAKKSRALTRANSYFDSGEYDKAKIEYLNVLRADPQNATAVERLGTIWDEQGAPLHAAPFLLRTRDLAPDNLAARVKLGLILLANG